MIRRILDTIARALLRPMNMGVVLVLGLYTFLWGLWVINPFWHVFGHAALYDMLNAYGGEGFWGAFAIATGTLTTWGATRGRAPYIYWGTGAAGWHWFIIGIFYFMGDWHNTGGITALFLAVLSATVYLNVKVNYTHEDTKTDD